ncbi:Tol-Pal system protein TolB [Parvularcula sp. ZS-1/3]|uniref:Tol-Pal system protein TolB n=1 Tax=Parvularcula mediterranea TaxID=2732508 RepID=A0A7Y3W5W4_9PROT|nr:Tol-Pal system beta propeller repeat protein TolB [Parvularcula mediterranea]NNU16928.1 Tol-Pal system protein TolB [Parvularcula mediterranea]
MLRQVFLAIVLTFLPAVSLAQVEIDITRGRSDPMPIAIPDYLSAEEPELAGDIAKVIRNDLSTSGLLDPIDQQAFIEKLTNINVTPRFADWRVIGARVLLAGEVLDLGDGRVQINTRLWDVVGNQQVASVAYKTPKENWRRAAHKVSDFVYTQLTGESGYFDSRIVYVAETGPKERRDKRLVIMDQDGANPQVLTEGLSYDVLTPRFSPDEQEITYLAFFEDRPAKVYVFNIETGSQREVGEFPGMTFAPRFTPGGDELLISFALNGNSDVAYLNPVSGRLRRLTNNPAIDVSPSMSPDGSRIAFASDRGGSQQIYVMDADGARQQRITFGEGTYGTPVWSPRGDLIAFTRQHRGRFYIGVVAPDGSGERLLTEAYLVEGPTWSPNGRVLAFHREEYPGAPVRLWAIDLTGQNLRRLPTRTEASDPAWSPRLN